MNRMAEEAKAAVKLVLMIVGFLALISFICVVEFAPTVAFLKYIFS